ncbi:hypothetical protein [Rhizobium halophytocola]|uniref:Uncharacterized protein n=1 Tax=Rhizobium halophytocola TaxID=735519 RepID=A0ABS4DVZ7_9HYPH|nr:hypothetical protein [Rhizobium halophytocola]MBP1849871.1 hypothetical protein [Rhizobium halophytocola]
MSFFSWAFIFGLVIVFAYFSTRLTKREDEEGLGDTGLAILEFGRAFPNEAIRSLHTTADQQTVFVRLFDNRAGFMRQTRHHYACHLIEPGTIRVQPLADGKGFAVEFREFPSQSGEFRFANVKEAAEVSLWMLENQVAPQHGGPLPDGPLPSV